MDDRLAKWPGRDALAFRDALGAAKLSHAREAGKTWRPDVINHAMDLYEGSGRGPAAARHAVAVAVAAKPAPPPAEDPYRFDLERFNDVPHRDQMVKHTDHAAAMRSPYWRDGKALAAKTEVPAPASPHAVGTWKLDDRGPGPNGHDVDQLLDMPVSALDAPALSADAEGHAGTYADWMQKGHKAPPISVVQHDDGRFRVVDGAKRLAAAKKAKRPTVQAWVNHAVEDDAGNVHGLTYERLQKAGKVPSDPPARATTATPARPAPEEPSRLERERDVLARVDYLDGRHGGDKQLSAGDVSHLHRELGGIEKDIEGEDGHVTARGKILALRDKAHRQRPAQGPALWPEGS